MSVLRHRKNKDAVAASSEQLSSSINHKNPGAAVSIPTGAMKPEAGADLNLNLVRYWANMGSATTAKIISVDDSGVDVQFTLGAEPKKHEVRIQFKAAVQTPAEAREKVESMAAEARKILGVEVDTTYTAVSRRKKVDFHLPDITTMVCMLAVWAFVISLKFLTDDMLPEPLILLRQALGDDSMGRLVLVLCIINGVLTALSLAFCLFARIPLGATILWMPTVFLFGIPSMQNCMKIAIKHLLPRYPEFFGIPKGVLPDDPETIKKNAKIAEIKKRQEELEKRRH
ncbi:hypothetical protein HDU67_001725 [Dinochytrium kinnereticum]|nr:hypothetical protein HDU67_001725 [Dinochytrium kinnereticum]